MSSDPAQVQPRARVVVVMPVFHDVESFTEVRERAARKLRDVIGDSPVQFVLVDDTAGADPAVAALAPDPRTRVITPPYNLGHQGAIVFALRELLGDVSADDLVITMDADGEDRPEDLPTLLAPLLESADPHILAIAWRTRRRERLAFKTFYALFRLAFRITTGTVVRSGNFAAARGALIARTIDHPSFDQCYSSTLISLPFRRRYVPLPRGERYRGRSRMGYMKLITHGINMFMPFLEIVAVRFLIAASVAFVLSFLGLAAVAALHFLTDVRLDAWIFPVLLIAVHGTVTALLLCLILFAASAQFKAQHLRVLRPRQPAGWKG